MKHAQNKVSCERHVTGEEARASQAGLPRVHLLQHQSITPDMKTQTKLLPRNAKHLTGDKSGVKKHTTVHGMFHSTNIKGFLN